MQGGELLPPQPETLRPDEIAALWFNQDAIRVAPERVYRLDMKDNRLYYTVDNDPATDEKERTKYYLSVTTLAQLLIPKGYALERWLMANSFNSIEIKNERAEYGTFMHILITKFLIQKRFDIDTLDTELLRHITDNKIECDFERWYADAKNDLLSFAQMANDYAIEVIAIEIMLADPTAGIAGALDLVCKMYPKLYKDTPEAKRKKVIAILDYKSGRKGFYEQHEFQLHAYRKIWNQNFPELQVETVFNWAPVEWTKRPTYKLQDQTESKFGVALPHYIEVAKVMFGDWKKSRKLISGIIELGQSPANYDAEPLNIVINYSGKKAVEQASDTRVSVESESD